MIGNGVIVVLCGLPASGKSHLAELLQDRINSGLMDSNVSKTSEDKYILRCFVIDYDKLMPPSVEKELIEISTDQLQQGKSSWKMYREAILKATDVFLAELSSTNPKDTSLREIISNIKQHNQKLLLIKENYKPVLVIDDNMYLRSMRHPYYQLARKHFYGFCEVHVQCDWHHQRNATRDSKVNEMTMRTMAKKFELPSQARSTYTIRNNDDHYETCWMELESLIRDSISCPILELEDESENKEISRLICLQNVLHKADHLLRIIVSEIMSEHKSKLDKNGLAALGKKLNCARQETLGKIKSSAIVVPEQIANKVETGNFDSINVDFKKFLKDTITF